MLWRGLLSGGPWERRQGQGRVGEELWEAPGEQRALDHRQHRGSLGEPCGVIPQAQPGSAQSLLGPRCVAPAAVARVSGQWP